MIPINLLAQANFRGQADRVPRQRLILRRAKIVGFAAGRSVVIPEEHVSPGGIGLSLHPSIEKMRLLVDLYPNQS